MTDRHKKIVSIIAIVIFLVVCGAVTVFVGGPMVRMAKDPELFRQWVDSFGIWGRVIFVGLVVLQVVVALIPGEPVELCAGYAFGTWEGLGLCLLGIAIGSFVVFQAVRKWGIKLVEVFFPMEKIQSLWFLRDPKRVRIATVLVMTIPGTPKDLLSYAAGLTSLRLGEWMLIAVIARIPSVLTSTISGSAVGERRYLFAVVVYGLTLAVSLLGVWFYNRYTQKKDQ